MKIHFAYASDATLLRAFQGQFLGNVGSSVVVIVLLRCSAGTRNNNAKVPALMVVYYLAFFPGTVLNSGLHQQLEC
jgi:hypothetical protein